MGPIWSITALTFVTFTWSLHLSWIIYAPWLLCTEPVMCHGSYMIHDCSTRSLTFLMDHMWSMNALHGALHIPWIYMIHDSSSQSLCWCYWVLNDSAAWLLYTEPVMCHESNLGPTTALPGPGMEYLSCDVCPNLNTWLPTQGPGTCHVSKPEHMTARTGALHVSCAQIRTHDCPHMGLSCIMCPKPNPWLPLQGPIMCHVFKLETMTAHMRA